MKKPNLKKLYVKINKQYFDNTDLQTFMKFWINLAQFESWIDRLIFRQMELNSMKKILLLIFISRSLLGYSQETKPKLVVGIVVDQMHGRRHEQPSQGAV